MKKKEWEETKSFFLDWLHETKLKELICKNIVLKGYSLWWSNLIIDKDIIYNNKWFFDLNLLLNKKKIKKTKNVFFITLLKHFCKNLIYLLLFKILFKNKLSNRNKENCYLVFYERMVNFKNFFVDPRFSLAPFKNKKNNSLLVTLPFSLETIINFAKIKKNLNLNQIDYFFLHNYITFKKFFSIYLSVFKLFLISKKIISQKNYFIINKIDCSGTLKKLFLKSYSGEIQSTIIYALCIQEFLKKNKHKKFVNYFEFFPGSRAIYFFLRKLNYKLKIVTVQHGIFAKNNLFYHLNKTDFVNDKGKHLVSPIPDYFLTSGSEYAHYLKKNIPNTKVFTIGAPKLDFFNKFKKQKKIKNHLNKLSNNKKILLIITAINDEKYMINFLNKVDLKNIYVIVSPFYFYKKQTILNFKNMATFNYNFLKDFSTKQLMFYSDLIIGGMSSVSYEALFHNLNIIRVTDHSFPLQSNESDNIPLVDNSKLFNKYFNYHKKVKRNKIKDTTKKMFYKIDKKAYQRLSKFLANLN